MKKIYFATISAVLMMLAAACSNEAVEPTDQATVQFTVNLDGIQSRGISDGTTVDQLIFAVYDQDGNELPQLRQNDIEVKERNAQVTTQVALGQKYTFVFWAQKSGNNYYNTADLKDVVINYEGEGEGEGYANDETRDAFTAVLPIDKVTGPINETVTLRRPFAQVDYVCDLTEWTDLQNSNYRLTGSDLTVNAGAFTHLNLLTGEASQPTTVPIKFAMSNYWRTHHVSTYEFCGFVSSKVDGQYKDLFTNGDGDDMFWLSMNYILASTEQTTLDHTQMNIYIWGGGQSDPSPIEIPIDNLPIQRNHRTVVSVSNLTHMVDVLIEINPNFYGDING